MFPSLPQGIPFTPLPEEYSLAARSTDTKAPGIPLQSLKPSQFAAIPLPFFHSVDIEFPGLQVLHLDPPVFVVDKFLTPRECDELLQLSEKPDQTLEVASPTFGGAFASGRTSTTWFCCTIFLPFTLHSLHARFSKHKFPELSRFCRYEAASTLLRRTSALLGGVDTRRFEEPQVVRYEPGQQFKWHLDQVPKSQLANGGQRLVTTLVDCKPSFLKCSQISPTAWLCKHSLVHIFHHFPHGLTLLGELDLSYPNLSQQGVLE
jgi:hypothetical protein